MTTWSSTSPAERERLIEHLDGVRWWETPIPSRLHRCRPQTRAVLDGIERCRCGAIRVRGGRWMQRNTRVFRGDRGWGNVEEEDRVWLEETLAGQIEQLRSAASELVDVVRGAFARRRREE